MDKGNKRILDYPHGEKWLFFANAYLTSRYV